MQKVSLFIDVQNIYYTTKNTFNCNFDYNKFWALATSNRTVEHAFAYAIDRGDEKQKQFQNILRAIGFEVKLKPYIQRLDGSSKGDWDVGIAIDMIEHCKNSDVAVLASGDGDFDILVQKIQDKYEIPVEVYGVRALTSSTLIDAASVYYPIERSLLL
ncbi:MAG: NYN domain-containing protein [Agarilytica sp.]